VDQLCAAAEADGRHIIRDRTAMGLGDSISAFASRIGGGDRVFVILSEKFLRSQHCMLELREIWIASRQNQRAFLDRVRVYTLPDAKIWRAADRVDHAIYWREEFESLNARAQKHGATILGEDGQRRLMQMQQYYTQVADILAAVADIRQPRTFDELRLYGFDPS
jgi:internalin A